MVNIIYTNVILYLYNEGCGSDGSFFPNEKHRFTKLFGEFVRMKRKQLNLSQQQLAYKMGLDYQYISRVERGLISPTLFWIVGLSKVLETTLDQFVSELYLHIQR